MTRLRWLALAAVVCIALTWAFLSFQAKKPKEGTAPASAGPPRTGTSQSDPRCEAVPRLCAAQSAPNGSNVQLTAAEQATLDQIDRDQQIERAALTSEQVLFNAPTSLPYRRPSTLIASIASASVEQAQARVSTGVGDVKRVSVMVTPQVRAELTGPAEQVDIVAVGPPTRAISKVGNATWSWYVTPKVIDVIELRLSFYNIVKVDGEDREIDGPAESHFFDVNVSWLDWLYYWWQRASTEIVSAAAVVGALAGLWRWIASRRAERKPAGRQKRS